MTGNTNSAASVRIRAFVEADGRRTLEIFERAVRITARAHYTEGEVEAWLGGRRDPARWAADRLATGTLVAEIEGVVVGFTDLRDDGYIDRLFVDPDVGRRGIGAALLCEVRERASVRGITALSTHASLVARPVFERAGFDVSFEETVERSGETLRRFFMTAEISHDRERTP